MMPEAIKVTIPTPDQHWENILKVVTFWLNVTISDEDIKDMIKLTRSYYGDNCARRWCDILLRLENNGCDDSKISKIINYVPRFMNGSLKSSLKLSGLTYNNYFIRDYSCQQIFYRLGKQGAKIALIR